MYWAISKSLHDIYKCTRCAKPVGHGDNFCKHCGHEFTADEVATMTKGKWHFAGGDYVLLALVVVSVLLALVALINS